LLCFCCASPRDLVRPACLPSVPIRTQSPPAMVFLFSMPPSHGFPKTRAWELPGLAQVFICVPVVHSCPGGVSTVLISFSKGQWPQDLHFSFPFPSSPHPRNFYFCGELAFWMGTQSLASPRAIHHRWTVNSMLFGGVHNAPRISTILL